MSGQCSELVLQTGQIGNQVKTLSALQQRVSRWLFIGIASACLAACAAEPVIVPTELKSIQVEDAVQSLWRASVGKSKKGEFEPLALDGAVYAASYNGMVTALDKSNGKVLWSSALKQNLSSGVGGADGLLYVAAESGSIIALNQSDGSVVWEQATSSEVLTPVSAGFGVAVVRSADGRVVVLDAKTGEEQWSATYTPPALTINGYARPLILDGGVLLGLDDGRLLALAMSDGRVIWESVLSAPTGRSEIERLVDLDANIRVDDSAIFAVNYQGKLARIEPSKGQITWSVPMSSTTGLGVSDKAVVVVNDKDELQAVDKTNGQLLWTQTALRGRRISAPQIIGNDRIVVGDYEGYLHLLASDDGRLIGRTRPARKPIFPELVLSDDIVYFQSIDGTVGAFQAQP